MLHQALINAGIALENMKNVDEAIEVYNHVKRSAEDEVLRNRANFMMVSALVRQSYAHSKAGQFVLDEFEFFLSLIS